MRGFDTCVAVGRTGKTLVESRDAVVGGLGKSRMLVEGRERWRELCWQVVRQSEVVNV